MTNRELCRQYVVIRDHKKCQRCTRYGSDASHVIERARSKRLSDDPQNVKLLCRKCHMRRHGNLSQALHWFAGKRPDRWDHIQQQLAESVHLPIGWVELRTKELLSLLEEVSKSR